MISGIDYNSNSHDEWNVKGLNELFIESYRQYHQLVLYENDNNDEKIIFASVINIMIYLYHIIISYQLLLSSQ